MTPNLCLRNVTVVSIACERESDNEGNLLDTYVVSDSGDLFDEDECDLTRSEAADAVSERVAEYKAEGWTAILEVPPEVAQWVEE